MADMEIVNDAYWLKYGKVSIEQALTSRNQAAAKLEKMTLWFWGLYTASFTIGVSINIIEAPLFILIMLAAPIVLLIFTYWLCIQAQLPVNAAFDPTIPYEIKVAHDAGLEVKNKRFKLARIFTFVSALLLSSALFSLSFVNKKTIQSFDVSYDKQSSLLLVSGTFPKGTIVSTEIDSLVSASERIQFYQNTYKIQENGLLNLNISLVKQPREITVSTTWIENDQKNGYIKTLTK